MRKLEGQQLQKLLKSISISQSEHQLFVMQVKIESTNFFFCKLDDLVSNFAVFMGLKTG